MRSLILAVSLLTALPASAADPAVIHLWSGKAPGEQAEVAAEQITRSPAGDRIDRITNVSDPTVTVFLPAAAREVAA